MSIKNNIENANLKWDKIPECWEDAPYIGNGMVGTIFWLDQNKNLFFEMGRSDFYDHRNSNYSLLHRNCRLKIGNFSLVVDNEPVLGNMELDLYTASVKASLETASSKVNARFFACDNTDVLVFEFEKVSGACDIQLSYNPYPCESSRNISVPEGYRAYPPACFKYENEVCVAIQNLPEDDIYNNVGKGDAQLALGWYREEDEKYVHFYISIHYSYPGKTADKTVLENINFAREQGIDNLFVQHCKFWDDFYSSSAVLSLSDKQIENYYYLELYRFGSAARKDGIVLDLMGPWYKKTPWPAIWWNLNQQSTYSHIAIANHPELYMPLIDFLYNNRQKLADNCELGRDDVYALDRACGMAVDEKNDVQHEYGNLGYMLYYIWEMYRTVMDDKLLEEKILPLMIGAFKYLLTKTYVADDGKIHFLPSASPEYTWAFVESGAVEDCSFTIAVTRWLAKTIISCTQRLGKSFDVLKECNNILENSVEYVTGENGIYIGKDLPFEHSHRHWSHMFMLYPFCEYTFEDENMKPIFEKSLETWLSDRYCFSGFAYAGAASIYSMMGKGDICLGFLNDYFNNCNPEMFHKCSNGMYCEGINASAPVIETPFAILRSVEDMLLSSYNDVIRIMPALPSSWESAEYENFRAQGAFLISAKAQNGIVSYVKIESLMGEKCVVNISNLSHLVCDKEMIMAADNTAQIKLNKGESCVFC